MLKQYNSSTTKPKFHNNSRKILIYSVCEVFFILFILSYHITSYETKYLLSINWSEMTKIFCFFSDLIFVVFHLFSSNFIISYYIKSCHNYKWWFYHLLKISNKAYLYVIVLFIINKSWIRPKLVTELKKLTFSCMLFILVETKIIDSFKIKTWFCYSQSCLLFLSFSSFRRIYTQEYFSLSFTFGCKQLVFFLFLFFERALNNKKKL